MLVKSDLLGLIISLIESAIRKLYEKKWKKRIAVMKMTNVNVLNSEKYT